MVQGLAFLSKKSWHVKNISNQEKVWMAEQQKAAEDQKTKELAKQIQQEREQEEMDRIAGKKSHRLDRGIDWMYDKGGAAAKEVETKRAEEYLLGKEFVAPGASKGGDFAVDNDGVNAVVAEAAKKPPPLKAAALPAGPVRPEEPSVADRNEGFRIRHEDPMYNVRRQEHDKQVKSEKQRALYNRVAGTRKEQETSDDDDENSRRRAKRGRRERKERKREKKRHKRSHRYDRDDSYGRDRRHRRKHHHDRSRSRSRDRYSRNDDRCDRKRSYRSRSSSRSQSKERRYRRSESPDDRYHRRSRSPNYYDNSTRRRDDSRERYGHGRDRKRESDRGYHERGDRDTELHDSRKQAGYGLQGGSSSNVRPSDLGPDRELLARKRKEREDAKRSAKEASSTRRRRTSEEREQALRDMQAAATTRDAARASSMRMKHDDGDERPRGSASFLNDMAKRQHGIDNDGQSMASRLAENRHKHQKHADDDFM